MQVAILAQEFNNYSIQRLTQALEAKNHSVNLVSPLQCVVKIDNQIPEISFLGNDLKTVDVALLRCSGYTWFSTNVVRKLESYVAKQLKLSGAICINDPEYKLQAHDKFASLQILSSAGIPVPTTYLLWNADLVETIIDTLGVPTMLKAIEGTQGIGVIRTDTKASTHATFDALKNSGQVFVIQEYVKEAENTDIRAFVIDQQVVGAIRRIAKDNEFRSNIHRGGKAESVKLPVEYEKIALMATKALKMEVAGVDILETKDGPKVIEVNPSAGLEAIERITNIKVADLIVEHIEHLLLNKNIL